MATQFIKKFTKEFIRTPLQRLLVTSVLPVSFLAFGLTYCSNEGGFFSSDLNAKVTPLLVPVSLVYQPKASLSLQGDEGGLNLASGTSLWVSVDGCDSGYTFTSALLTNAFVRLYKSDINCKVKLKKFTYQSKVYESGVAGATDFTTWAANDTAVFAVSGDAADQIRVFVSDPVNLAGVESSEAIVYKFTDIAAGTAVSPSQSDVSTSATLAVDGQDPPQFKMINAEFLGIVSGGSAEMAFTFECWDLSGNVGSNVTGTGTTTQCEGDYLDASQNILDYLLVPDAELDSAGSPTIEEANDFFELPIASQGYSENIREIATTEIIPIGGSDDFSNVVASGGFETSSTSPLVTEGGAIYASNLTHDFIIRRKDSIGNTLSYEYFVVNIASITQN